MAVQDLAHSTDPNPGNVRYCRSLGFICGSHPATSANLYKIGSRFASKNLDHAVGIDDLSQARKGFTTGQAYILYTCLYQSESAIRISNRKGGPRVGELVTEKGFTAGGFVHVYIDYVFVYLYLVYNMCLFTYIWYIGKLRAPSHLLTLAQPCDRRFHPTCLKNP